MKIKRLSLKKNFSWNFISNLIFAATQWGILSIIAKLGSPTMVGQYALGLAITAPIVLLFSFQLRAIQATDIKDSFSFSEYFGLRIISSAFTLFVLVLFVALSNYDRETSIIIILIGMLKLIDGLSDIVYGYFQKIERMDYSSISKIIKGLLTIIIVLIVFIITNNLIIVIFSICLTYLLIFAFYDTRKLISLIEITPSFSKEKMISLLKKSYPLGIVLMLSSLYTNIPRFFLEKYGGIESLGFFSAIAYLLVAGNTFISAVGQAISPRLATEYSKSNFERFQKLLKKSMSIGFLLGVIIFILSLFFGKQILTLLYTEQYAAYNHLFTLLSVSAIITFTSSFLGYAITATRSFRIQPYLALIWTISSLLCSLILIPSYELYGAVFTLILSSFIQLIVQYLYLRKKITTKILYSDNTKKNI